MIRRSIKIQLISMTVFVSLISLTLGIITLILYDSRKYLENLVDRTTLIAKTVGNYAAADIAFGNQRAATETLSHLKDNTEIIQASLYDHEGNWFAGYHVLESDRRTRLNLTSMKTVIDKQSLTLTLPIESGTRNWGYIQVTSSKEGINRQIQQRLNILLILGSALTLLALLLATLLQRFISRPILELAETAKNISNELKYSTRIPVNRKDEIGELFSSFNLMMTTIEKRKNQRDLAENELRKTNQLLQGIITANPLATILLDASGTVRLWSSSAEKLFGWTGEEAMGHFFPAIPGGQRVDFLRNLQRITQGENLLGEGARFLKRGGESIEITFWGVFVPEKKLKGECLILVADVTEKKKLEEELIKSQRLESLGILAGGIAHDFNNILMGILGNISLAKTLVSTENPLLMNRLNDTEVASIRASKLAQQLLTFSKGGEPIKKTIALPDLIEKTVKFSITGTGIQIVYSFQEDLWTVLIDENQISQVIQNLIINAIQAMSDKGLIHIKAVNYPIHERSKGRLPLEKGKYVEISILDEGKGIPDEIQDKIFNPFFTTKTNGSGLGLSISHSIMKKHKGYMTFQSIPGKGTTFFLYLPASFQTIDRVEMKGELIRGRGRILIMDDDVDLLKVVGQMVEYLGYEVAMVRDGETGIQEYLKWKNKNLPFDLVLTDLTVPAGMGGIEFLNQLKKIDPGAKVVVSSGYSNNPALADFQSFGFSGVIFKPYNVSELSSVFYQVIFGH